MSNVKFHSMEQVAVQRTPKSQESRQGEESAVNALEEPEETDEDLQNSMKISGDRCFFRRARFTSRVSLMRNLEIHN